MGTSPEGYAPDLNAKLDDEGALWVVDNNSVSEAVHALGEFGRRGSLDDRWRRLDLSHINRQRHLGALAVVAASANSHPRDHGRRGEAHHARVLPHLDSFPQKGAIVLY